MKTKKEDTKEHEFINGLIHAVINQLEMDFNDSDYDAMDEMLALLIRNKDAKEILINYLSDYMRTDYENKKVDMRY